MSPGEAEFAQKLAESLAKKEAVKKVLDTLGIEYKIRK